MAAETSIYNHLLFRLTRPWHFTLEEFERDVCSPYSSTLTYFPALLGDSSSKVKLHYYKIFHYYPTFTNIGLQGRGGVYWLDTADYGKNWIALRGGICEGC